MPYRESVCCTPNRFARLLLAPGEGASPVSYYVMGSKGWEVSRTGRAIALRAWETRRRNEAARKAAAEAARPRHLVIEGTLPEQAPDAQPTRALTLV